MKWKRGLGGVCQSEKPGFQVNFGKLVGQPHGPWKGIHARSYGFFFCFSRECKNKHLGASLEAQWLRIRLPMQGTLVLALVQVDPTCHGATKPVHHNY